MADDLDEIDKNILLDMDITGSYRPSSAENLQRCNRLAQLGYARSAVVAPHPDLPSVELYRITAKGRAVLGTTR